LLPDETVASWADRQPGVALRSDSEYEDTFGQLTIVLPELPHTLRRELLRAAQPPDEWLLRPHQRTLQCPRCLAEDWAQGVPAYNRRAWCVAWRTCCPRHGVLFDTEKRERPPGWVSLLEGRRWDSGHLFIAPAKGYRVLLHLSLGADRRAIHLEAALAGRRRGTWFPKGMTQDTLRTIYREIVSDLLSQFYMDRSGPKEQRPSPGFNCALNFNRFTINVLAEAVLSEWTGTPLPTSALALRTPLLMRAIGWGEGRPTHVKGGQVLLRGPSERTHPLVNYTSLLRQEDFARLARPEAGRHVGYLTLPEARLLGSSCSEAVSALTQLTTLGQFLAFDARRGCLVENRHLPAQARLAPEQAPEHVLLPAWAFRPSTPPEQEMVSYDDLHDVFGARSPDSKLRWTARQRRQLRKERKHVIFHSVRSGNAPVWGDKTDPNA
jgi:hypothetical protein